MVGVVGYTKFYHVPEDSVLYNMLKTIVTNEFQDSTIHHDTITDIGVSFLKSINSIHISLNTNSGWNALLYGWIYNDECINRKNHAECLLQVWLKHGVDEFKGLSGSFCGILWNNRERKVVLVTDKLGTRPLYYAIKDRELIFSTHARAILQYPGFPKRVNELAIAKFLTYGKVGIIGDDTFFDGVKIVPPASVLTFSKEGVKVYQYWDLEYMEDERFRMKKYVENLTKMYVKATNSMANRFNNIALQLSGGLDSRSILASLNATNLRKILAITFGVEKSLDLEIAKKAASKFGVKHLIIKLDPEELRKYAEYVVYVTDGQDIPTVSYLPYVMRKIIEHGSNTIMQGFAFDLLLGGSYLREEYFKAKSNEDFILSLEKSSVLFSTNELKCLLGDKLSNLINDARKEFIKVAMSCKGNSFPNKADYFFMRTRIRRFTLMGSIIDREFAEELLPTIADDVLSIIVKIPARERYRHKFYREFLLRLSIDASKVPYANTLVPPILPHKLWSPVQGFFFIIDKVMKKLSRERVSISSSYFDFDKVLRESRRWRGVLNDLLVREDALVYRLGYLNRQCVLKIIRDHLKGIDNGSKLAYLMSLEIFLRLFFSDSIS